MTAKTASVTDCDPFGCFTSACCSPFDYSPVPDAHSVGVSTYEENSPVLVRRKDGSLDYVPMSQLLSGMELVTFSPRFASYLTRTCDVTSLVTKQEIHPFRRLDADVNDMVAIYLRHCEKPIMVTALDGVCTSSKNLFLNRFFSWSPVLELKAGDMIVCFNDRAKKIMAERGGHSFTFDVNCLTTVERVERISRTKTQRRKITFQQPAEAILSHHPGIVVGGLLLRGALFTPGEQEA